MGIDMTLFKFSQLSMLISALSTLVGWTVFIPRVSSNSIMSAVAAGIGGFSGAFLVSKFVLCPRRVGRYHGKLDVREPIPEGKREETMMQVTFLLPVIMNGFAIVVLLGTTFPAHSVGWIIEASAVITGGQLGNYLFYRELSSR